MEENNYCAGVMMASIFPLNMFSVKVIFKVRNTEKQVKTLSLISVFKKLSENLQNFRNLHSAWFKIR